MPTASYVRILGQDVWEKNYTAYDVLSRPIINEKKNHLGGYTITESKLNFRGLPTKTTVKHRRDSDSSLVVDTHDFFEYDHALRMVYHTQDLGNLSGIQVISRNTYDELGQLIEKGVGGEVLDNDRWQNISYRYNIRGWLTDINDIYQLMGGVGLIPPAAHDDLFSFKIFYDQNNVGTSNEPLYNGNINQTFWKTGSDNNVRGYNYTYDKLNRLRNANFIIGSTPSDAYREALTYDVNGNIQQLYRTTGDGGSSGYSVEMDDLEYQYQTNSNLLLNVTDNAGSDDMNGFIDGNTGPKDDYDNGNLVLDRNKDIQSITYNHLNLPGKITFGNGKYIEYKYNAAGQKVHKEVYVGEGDHMYEMIDYLDGFQYAGGVLQYFPTAEGYVNVTAAVENYVPIAYRFNYVYNYTDHLGNIRVSYTKDPQSGKLKIIDENHYYPFGLKHERYLPLEKWRFMLDKNDKEKTILKIALTDEYKYKYQGQELQDELGLNWYSFKWRNYMPDIGRFFNVDPLSEKYAYQSHYNFSENRVIDARELEGLEKVDFRETEVQRMHNYFRNNAASGANRADCITCHNKGMRVLLDKSNLKVGSTASETRSKMQNAGYAGDTQTIRFNDANGDRAKTPAQVESMDGSLASTAAGLTPEPSGQVGDTSNSVFGVSINDGYHTMTLTVTKTTSQALFPGATSDDTYTSTSYTLSDQGTAATDGQGNKSFMFGKDLDSHMTDYVQGRENTRTANGSEYPARVEIHQIQEP